MVCAWPLDPACVADGWAALDEDVQERSLMLATSSLITLTYGRVGTCPITVRPSLAPTCACWEPRLWEGAWYNCASCGTKASPTSEIELDGPVGYVDSIRIDGVEHDPTNGDWRLDEGRFLVWQGSGPSPIPAGQDLNKPDTAVGTWSITYSQSYPIGEDGRLAVALLAMEFAKACQPKSKCSLPKGVQNVSRNGVSFVIEAGLFPGGLTGIEIVDQFILKWAPAGAPLRNAQVFNPRTGRVSRNRRTNSIPAPSPMGGFGAGGFGQ